MKKQKTKLEIKEVETMNTETKKDCACPANTFLEVIGMLTLLSVVIALLVCGIAFVTEHYEMRTTLHVLESKVSALDTQVFYRSYSQPCGFTTAVSQEGTLTLPSSSSDSISATGTFSTTALQSGNVLTSDGKGGVVVGHRQ